MGVTRMQARESSSDDNQSDAWGLEESDWRTSSSSEPALTPRFSLVALPGKVRDSVFRRPARRPPRKTKHRSSTADTTRTSSASSTPRDSVLVTRPRSEGENVEKFRVFWDEKLRCTMDRLAGSRSKTDDENDVFHLLLKLYAHQDVVEQLYSSYDANAAEFEFYIPQLCTFLLHGNYAKQHQLECFLMSRSGESLPFAHRLTWFLRSFCDNAKEYQSEYLSVTASQDQENSDLLTAIGRRAGVPALLMNSGLCVEEVSAAKPDNLQRRRSIIFPTDSELDSTTLETDESFAGHLLSKRNSIQDEARTDEGNSQQISLFKQTPKFVEALTDLAEQLIPTPRPRRNSKLRKGLNEIQEQMLPSDVIYLPIGNSYHRVKGIQVDECFTFSTKERVPYFLCVEVLDYSVPSHTSSSKKPRKRKKSKASRNQSRVFSLKLPFTNTGVDLTMTVDDSPMSSSTSPESELSLIPSPSVTSPLPEIEEEKGPIVSDSSTPLQETGEAPTDGEYGDDEKEGDARKSRKSFQEDESLQKAEEEQQERLGQWNLPRPRRRSIKEYSSSASARSGGQFDSFYSSWFSKKTQQEDDENCDATDAQPTTEDVSENVSDKGKIESFDSTEMVPEETKNEEAGSITAEELPNVFKSVPVPVLSTVISNSDVENNNLNDAVTESKPEANKTTSTEPSSMAPESSAPTAKAGIFSTLFYKQPKPVVENAHQSTLLSSDQKNHESAPCQELPGADVPKPGSLGTSAASSAPTQSSGLFSTLFSKKASEALVPSSSSTVPSTLAKDNSKSGEATASSSEECEATPEDVETQSVVVHTEPVGIFSSLFAKKTQQITEATALDADGAASVSSLEPSEEGALDDLDAEDADGEESESKEALPPDNDPAADDVSSLEQNEQDLTDDLDAEDADSEDTDSNGALFSDDECITCEPEPSPAKVPSERQTSFVSWFSRKPAAEVAVDTGVATVKATIDTEANACANDNAASPKRADATEDAGSSEPSAHVVEDKNAAQDEVLPAQRPRDLSVSLDFADPTAWKEKFDLEDGLTDDEPDVETADTDVVDADANEELGESDDDDEKPMIVFRERWSEKESRIRRESPFGDHPGWRLLSVIVKSNDDLRQEQFAAQLIAQCDRIFREYALPLSLRPYNVIATSAKTGLIEAVPDTVSLDSLKRNDPGYTTLLDFYTRLHGDIETTGFARAQRNFVESLAAYSIVCYVFQIKDRHNGNILVDTDGHVIHIDFGFLLTNSPGSNWNFERAPFKLTDEFVELMGGPRSSTFRYFRSLCIRAYLALRRNMDQIVLLVEMMLVGNADLPCFAGGKKAVIEGLRARLKPGARTSTCQVFVNQLIDQSINNWRTRWYDKYQRACLGIL